MDTLPWIVEEAIKKKMATPCEEPCGEPSFKKVKGTQPRSFFLGPSSNSPPSIRRSDQTKRGHLRLCTWGRAHSIIGFC